ncbi:hypothetical protein BDF19DRAFT_425279 [Syncephalis fuscata]|nr:hypothetical protein BDF19DRAFT_425279 [Syncephalis fuscata]
MIALNRPSAVLWGSLLVLFLNSQYTAAEHLTYTINPHSLDGICVDKPYSYVAYNVTATNQLQQAAGVYLMPKDTFDSIRLAGQDANATMAATRYDKLNSCPGDAKSTMNHCYIGLDKARQMATSTIGSCIAINNTHSAQQATFEITYAFGDTPNINVQNTKVLGTPNTNGAKDEKTNSASNDTARLLMTSTLGLLVIMSVLL